MQETQVLSLGQEDPLEEEMATHSSIIAWEIPWTEEPGGLQSMGSRRVGYDLVTKQQQAWKNNWNSYMTKRVEGIRLKKKTNWTQNIFSNLKERCNV